MRRYKFLFLWALLLAILPGGSLLRAEPASQGDTFGTFISNLRFDLNFLATQVVQGNPLPEGWTGNEDAGSSSYIADLWFDNELLGNQIFGSGIRPPEWLGITKNDAFYIARNTRHDLELSASQFFGGNTRPEAWRGAGAIFRCERGLQNLVVLLSSIYRIVPTTPDSALDYCAAVRGELEDSLLDKVFTSVDGEQVKELTLAMRGDLERLADERLGLNTRPDNWIGNKDRESATLIGDNFLDLETLATQLLGSDQRPPGWYGVVTNTPYVSYRNLRHDLELLSDAALGLDVRPRGWQGLNPIERCNTTTQDLVFIAQENFGFTTENIPAATFCETLSASVNQVAEAPPIEDIVEPQVDSQYLALSQSAFTYLDVGATQYMGVMPQGTEFRAWYRNFGESTMMFVSGEKFAVFLDQRWTTLPEEIYDNLPSLEGIAPLTFCDANWCNGPGPTPTPTGSGALELLLSASTPVAPSSEGEVSQKTQVSWNNIRVTYLQDNLETRTAQVALEICAEPAQITCEPVIRVFDNAVGAPKAVISTFNNLNVYEFRYGYTSNLLIEGSTLTSPDVWISDPTIR